MLTDIKPKFTVITLLGKKGQFRELKFPKVLTFCPYGCKVPSSFEQKLKIQFHENFYCNACNNDGIYLADNKYIFRLIYERYPMILEAMERSQHDDAQSFYESRGENLHLINEA